MGAALVENNTTVKKSAFKPLDPDSEPYLVKAEPKKVNDASKSTTASSSSAKN